MIETLYWKDDSIMILDQRALPLSVAYIKCTNAEEVAECIEEMAVRGAPAIGVAAAYGVVLSAKGGIDGVHKGIERLKKTRPTAINLRWALNRMGDTAEKKQQRLLGTLLEEANKIREEDIESCKRIGEFGVQCINDCANILTHCNAGALATAGSGTALSVIRMAFEKRKTIHVYVDETRPFLQGSRLTAFELKEDKIPFTLICDNMAGTLMKEGKINAVIVGADRIAANGDTANKIGTYSIAVLANYHKIPFYVAAPSSTFDLNIKNGLEIPIEKRASEEITTIGGIPVAPSGSEGYNPAFDVTPVNLIKAIITDKGVIEYPDEKKINELLHHQ